MASRRLEIIIAGDASGAVKALDKVSGAAGKTESKFSKFAKVGTAAFLGIGTAAAAFGAVSVKAALEGQKAQARYETAVKNAGGSVDVYNKKVEGLTGQYAKLGFENDELQDALAKMTTVTKSPTKALKDLGLAADIARARNISLVSAGDLLTKVLSGHVGLLGRLGIQTKDATGKTISQEAALRKLAEMYGGAAQRNAATFAGKTEALKAQLHNTEEAIGNKLIPILAKLSEWMLKLITWFQKHSGVAKALAIVIGTVLVVAVAAYTAAMISAAAATIAATWPILAVTAAVAALVAGVIYAWTHWDQIWNWIAHHKAYAILIAAIFPIIPVILGVIAAAKYVADHWDAIWGGLTAVLGGIWQGIKAIFTDGVNFVIRIMNDLIQAWNLIPFHDDIGKIAYIGTGSHESSSSGGYGKGNHRAMGGPVSAGAPYIVGERGPEWFVPGASGTIIPNGASAGGLHLTLNVVAGMGADARKFGADLADYLLQDHRSGGPVSSVLVKVAAGG